MEIDFFEPLDRLKPKFYDGILEMDELLKTVDGLYHQAVDVFNIAHQGQFIPRMNETFVKGMEDMLGIKSSNTETLEFRRLRLLNRFNTKPPFNLQFLQELISGFGNPSTLTILHNEYHLIADVNLEIQGQVPEVEYLFRSSVPANITFEINNTLKFKSPKETPFLALGLTVAEMVVITMDINKDLSSQSTGYQAMGGVLNQEVTITMDHISIGDIDVKATQGAGSTINQIIEL